MNGPWMKILLPFMNSWKITANRGEIVIYKKLIIISIWLVPLVQKFPRQHRFGLGERIQRLAMDFQDALVAAGKSRGTDRREWLQDADRCLEQLCLWLRMAHDLQIFSLRQYEHSSRLLAEVGRLLGTWLKSSSADFPIRIYVVQVKWTGVAGWFVEQQIEQRSP